MKKPPRPTSFKPKPPPSLNARSNPTFDYKPDKKDPSLDDTYPLAAKILHVVIVAFFITLGGTLLTLKSGGGIGWLIISGLFGIGYGIYSANKDAP